MGDQRLRKKLIICAGMIRSGSTLQYLIVKHILDELNIAYNEIQPINLDYEKINRLAKENVVNLIKTHNYTTDFVKIKNKFEITVFYSIRDPRSVFQSILMKENKEFEDLFSIRIGKQFLKDYYPWKKEANHISYYDNLVNNLQNEIILMSNLIGTITSDQAQKVIDYIQTTTKNALNTSFIVNEKYYYDPSTLLHYNHFNNGDEENWISYFTKDQILLLQQSFFKLIKQNGYRFKYYLPGLYFFKYNISHILKKARTIFWLKRVSHRLRMLRYRAQNLWRGSGNFIFAYQGFRVFHDHDDKLIKYCFTNQFIDNTIYESKISNTINSILRKYDHPIFVDVGFNLGLISLNIIRKNHDNVKIFGFEPGIYQYKMALKTIANNHLEKKIKLYNKAVYFENTNLDFCSHAGGNSSGDGIIDTRRAGDFQRIKVEAIKLDDWWEQEKRPHISVIKIDIEGAELYALKGAVNILTQIKPFLVFEFCIQNIKVYNYKPEQIIEFLHGFGYKLFTINNHLITIDNFLELYSNPKNQDTILAKPLSRPIFQ